MHTCIQYDLEIEDIIPAATPHLSHLILKHGSVEVDVEADASPGRPAYISGPPEDCYPAEDGELDNVKCSLTNKALFPGLVIEHEHLNPNTAERIDEKLWENVSDNYSAEADGLGDYLYEQEKDRRMMADIDHETRDPEKA